MPASNAGFRAAVRLALIAGLASLVLGGCDRDAARVEEPQPVLVVQPGAAEGAVADAFAGEVHARQESALSFRIGGDLVRRLVDAGDHVRAGEVLAELDPGDQRLQAQATQAQLAAAQAELARAGADRTRYAQLASQQLVSRSALDAQDAAYGAAAGQVRAIRAQLDVARNLADYTRLRAPRDGVIASREAEAGQVVAAGQTIYTLAGDVGREVAIALPEASIREHRVGDQAMVELWASGNGGGQARRLPGTIREIAPAADPQTRTYAARVTLAAGAGSAELGQSARVYLPGAGHHGLAVPLSALQRGTDGGSALWVVDPASRRVHLTPVRAGRLGSDAVPVLAGVAADQWIVAAGGHLLHEGERVAPVDRDNRPVFAATKAK
jgi:multidrug efflux system membrane fusion protein